MDGKEAIDWKDGFSHAPIVQGKTSSRRGQVMGGSLNLCFFFGTCVEKKTKEEEEWEKGKKYVGRKLVVKVLG